MEGSYHFLDANYGWFRFKDAKQFETWFQSYFLLSSYSDSYQTFEVNSYSLKREFSEEMQNILDNFIQFIQNKLSFLFSKSDTSTSLQEDTLPKKEIEKEKPNLVVNPNEEKAKLSEKDSLFSLQIRGLALEEPKKPIKNYSETKNQLPKSEFQLHDQGNKPVNRIK